MKIGLDLHGVVNDNPDFFRSFIDMVLYSCGEIHILSGPPLKLIKKELEDLEIYRHKKRFKIFSIVDHHKKIGTPMRQDSEGLWHTVKKENGVWVQDTYTWDKTKADYCLQHGIDLMIDDSDSYGYFFRTPYSRFFSKNKRKHNIIQGKIE